MTKTPEEKMDELLKDVPHIKIPGDISFEEWKKQMRDAVSGKTPVTKPTLNEDLEGPGK